MQVRVVLRHPPPTTDGAVFPSPTLSQEPSEVKMVRPWRKALLWRELREEALKQGSVNYLYFVLLLLSLQLTTEIHEMRTCI